MLDLTRPPPDCPASATRRIELHSRITVDPKTGYSPELKARVEAEIARAKTFEPLAAADAESLSLQSAIVTIDDSDMSGRGRRTREEIMRRSAEVRDAVGVPLPDKIPASAHYYL